MHVDLTLSMYVKKCNHGRMVVTLIIIKLPIDWIGESRLFLFTLVAWKFKRRDRWSETGVKKTSIGYPKTFSVPTLSVLIVIFGKHLNI